jgi:DNA-directed RNA polymerase specialized sigma24 family protein
LYREALSLYHLHDMSYIEMALITGAGIPALKQRVRRGTAMLQAAMARLYPELGPGRNVAEDK